MFISRKHYDDLRLEHAKAHEEARVLAHQVNAQQITMDWLRVRITQVERERAQFMFLHTGVKIEVPEIAAPEPPGKLHDVLAATPHFNDIGDKLAAEMGISWNQDGSVDYQA